LKALRRFSLNQRLSTQQLLKSEGGIKTETATNELRGHDQVGDGPLEEVAKSTNNVESMRYPPDVFNTKAQMLKLVRVPLEEGVPGVAVRTEIGSVLRGWDSEGGWKGGERGRDSVVAVPERAPAA
jgi:hypothetical protein